MQYRFCAYDTIARRELSGTVTAETPVAAIAAAAAAASMQTGNIVARVFRRHPAGIVAAAQFDCHGCRGLFLTAA